MIYYNNIKDLFIVEDDNNNNNIPITLYFIFTIGQRLYT